MQHNAAFHQLQNRASEKDIQYYFLKFITCHPSIYAIYNPDFIVSSFMENCIDLKKVKYIARLRAEHVMSLRQ